MQDYRLEVLRAGLMVLSLPAPQEARWLAKGSCGSKAPSAVPLRTRCLRCDGQTKGP